MHLAPNKIRQIINMDPESKMVSKEALVVIAKATEAFVRDLGGVCAQISKTQKRKTLLLNDLLLATQQIDRFHFIKDSKLPSLRQGSRETANAAASVQISSTTAVNQPVVTEDHKMADEEDEEERAMIEATDRAIQEDEAMDQLIEEMKEVTEEDF